MKQFAIAAHLNYRYINPDICQPWGHSLSHFAGTQSVWVSDGYNSVQMMVASDMDSAVNENDINESEEKPMQFTGSHWTILC